MLTWLCFLGTLVSCATIYIIRHAEKDPESASLSLVVKGEIRSHALSALFFPLYGISQFPVDTIIAMRPTEKHPAQRSLQTAQIIAEKVKMQVQTFTSSQEAELYDFVNWEIRQGKSVLIVWNHQLIASLASRFLESTIPSDWDKSVYDRIWKVKNGLLTEICQRLIFGDSNCPTVLKYPTS